MPLPGFDYDRRIPVPGKATATTNWQIELEVHEGVGACSPGVVYLNNHCITFPYDIRFTQDDGITEIDFWLDFTEYGSPRHFVVEIPDDCSSDQHFRIHYGDNVRLSNEIMLAGLLKSAGSFEKQSVDVYIPRGSKANFTKCWQYNDSAATKYTDDTTAVNNATASDWYPIPNTPQIEDAHYFGYSAKFHGILVNLSQVGNAVWTLVWEYWNGAAWVSLNVGDDTLSWKPTATGWWTVTWIMPTDWEQKSVGNNGDSVEAYYVRARLSSYTSLVAYPVGTQAQVIVKDSVETCTKPWIVQREGVFVCFYESLDLHWSVHGVYRIAYATASSIWGPWVKQGYCLQPSHVPGAIEEWGVLGPGVVPDGANWRLVFNTLHMADHSNDTIAVTSTTDANFPLGWGAVSAIVVCGAVGAWDDARVSCPVPFWDSDNNVWHVVYNAQHDSDVGAAQWQIGIVSTADATFATTTAGWAKSVNNPILAFGGVGAKDRYGLVCGGQPCKLNGDWYIFYNGADALSDFTKGWSFCAYAHHDVLTNVWTKANAGAPVNCTPLYSSTSFGLTGIINLNDGALYLPMGVCPRGAIADQYNAIGMMRLEYQPKGGAATFEAYYSFGSSLAALDLTKWDVSGVWVEEGQTGSAYANAGAAITGWDDATFLNVKIKVKYRLTTLPASADHHVGIGARKTTTTAGITTNGYYLGMRSAYHPTGNNLFLWMPSVVMTSYAEPNPDWSAWHTLTLGTHYDAGADVNTLSAWFDDDLRIDKYQVDKTYKVAGYVQIVDFNVDSDAGVANFDYFIVSKWIPDPPIAGTAGAENAAGGATISNAARMLAIGCL